MVTFPPLVASLLHNIVRFMELICSLFLYILPGCTNFEHALHSWSMSRHKSWEQYRITTMSMYDSMTCSLCFLDPQILVFVEHIFVIRVFQQINKKVLLYNIFLHNLL